MRQPIPFTKMTGSGNDFIVLEHRTRFLAEDEIVPFTRAVCRRGLGLGADGLILVEESPRADVHFRWRYFNADGSIGEMCGNGAMCGARFAVAHGIAPAECWFETDAGDIEAHVPDAANDPAVQLRLPGMASVGETVTLQVDGTLWAFDRLLAGVPHAVAWVDDADAAFDADEFARWGRLVRRDPAFAPAGTNVNLVHVIANENIRMRTYERGVEAETLACGTGAVVSAIAAVARGRVTPPVRVVTSSGEVLTVDFRREGDAITDVRLTGSARFIATGTLHPDVFR
jgi:diaminopimelate epimerase